MELVWDKKMADLEIRNNIKWYDEGNDAEPLLKQITNRCKYYDNVPIVFSGKLTMYWYLYYHLKQQRHRTCRKNFLF